MGPRHMREVCGQPATAGEARVRGDASAFVKHLDGGLGEARLDARVHELIHLRQGPCRAFAASRGWTVVADYADAAMSGASLMHSASNR